MSGEITHENEKEVKELRGELPEDQLRELAPHTLKGEWDSVIKMYEDYPATRTAMIDDATKNTALHVAIDLDEEKVVTKLVKAILNHKKNEALQVKNRNGDTPLHIAASRGFVGICKCIIGDNAERMHLVHLKNEKGETPLFLAALNWRKEAFAYLSNIPKCSVTLEDLVRNDGDSILHCAIQRELFDLAVIIMDYYGYLIKARINIEGFTPLKVLATRPSAFRSTTKLSWWKLILYHCVVIEPLDVQSTMQKILSKIEQPRDEEMKFPKNYATLCDFRKVADLFGKLLFWRRDEHDEENASKRLEKCQSRFWPPNYATIQQFVKYGYGHSLGLLGVEKVKMTKKKHKWSDQLLKAIFMGAPYHAYTGKSEAPSAPSDRNLETNRETTPPLTTQNDSKIQPQLLQCDCGRAHCNNNIGAAAIITAIKHLERGSNANEILDKKETPFLAAARNGIVEMVIMIQHKIKSAIHETNSMEQNVLLVAVKNRQPQVVQKLKKELKQKDWDNLIIGVDKDQNTMLHLAAESSGEVKRWHIAGSALQMMWDIKWYQYIKSIVPEHCYFRSNKDKKTAGQIFETSHEELIQKGNDWLKDTSESCSVVAALVAGVSFATASSVPGGTNDEGKPPLEGQPAFDAFAIASLIGLCFSVTGLIMFLSILTSRKEARDFRRGLPLKLLGGLSSLFVSIIAMFVSFCSGQFFIINHKYKKFLFPFYGVTSVPVAFYVLAQFPLYLDLLVAIIAKVPQASDTDGTL